MATRNLKYIEIDGSMGEGGGQVLRSSLTLSAITGKALRLFNIRAGRKNPGLRAQHLAAVDAAAHISKADVKGAQIGSKEIEFIPNQIRSGRFTFDIKTAGATTLVLQTIFIPLSLAKSASSVIITGGTHVAWSPIYHFISMHWLPYIKDIGYDAQFSIERAGYYPKGGGRITGTIRPQIGAEPLELYLRGQLLRISGISSVSNLPLSIADRQKRQAIQRLQNLPWINSHPEIHIKVEGFQSPGKGTFILLLAEFEGGRCCFSALGELGKPAERVADEAVDQLFDFMDTDGAIDPYLSDQILLPLSLASSPSTIRTSRITNHLITNALVIHTFTNSKINIEGKIGSPGEVNIIPDTNTTFRHDPEPA